MPPVTPSSTVFPFNMQVSPLSVGGCGRPPLCSVYSQDVYKRQAHIGPPSGGDKPRPYPLYTPPFLGAAFLAFQSAYMALFPILIVFYFSYIAIWS